MKSYVSESIVTKIAANEGLEATDVEPPLYDKIDPDALNSVFADSGSVSRTTGQVEFDYAGYHVTVTADQEISLTKIHDEAKS